METRTPALALLAAAVLAAGCAKNPMGPGSAGTNNGTAYSGVTEVQTNDVLFSPKTNVETSTRSPYFGGPISYSWGGASTTVIKASYPTPVLATTAQGLGYAPPTTNLVLLSPGIGGPTGNYANDYYVEWKGHKGPDPSYDYSNMVMYFAGTQVNYDLTTHGYRGFVFYARGKGNFDVALAGNGPPVATTPYSGYNYYLYVFGPQLSPTDWREFTVLFTDMQQTYGTAADLHAVLQQAWGLQFEQQPPLTSDFVLDVDYVRFF